MKKTTKVRRRMTELKSSATDEEPAATVAATSF